MNERMPIQVLNGIPGRAVAGVRYPALPDYRGLGGLGQTYTTIPATSVPLTTPVSTGTMTSIPISSGISTGMDTTALMNNIGTGVGIGTQLITAGLSAWQNVLDRRHDREMAEKRLAFDTSNLNFQRDLQAKREQEQAAEAEWRKTQMMMQMHDAAAGKGNGSMKKWLLFGGLGVAALVAVMLMVRSNQSDKMMMAQLMRQ